MQARVNVQAPGKPNMPPTKSLEFFFGEITPFPALAKRYPQLIKLTIVGQESLTSLRGLETLPNLKELWVVECNLRHITNLDNAEKLEKLFLFSNLIEVIDGLSRCTELNTLWLDKNRITAIAGLRQLPALRELNLAENNIRRLTEVDWGEKLEWLNLSGNPLPLTDLPALARLPRLGQLHLQDGMYRPAPCARLCNFRLFCVQLLPRLQLLDGQPVSEHERLSSRHHLASRLVYYRALCRHVQARCQQQLATLRQDWTAFLEAMGRRLRLLQIKIRQVEAAASSSAPEDGAEPPASEETLAAFRQAIQRRQECVTSVVRGQAAHSCERQHMLAKRRRLVQSLLELEYRTVGNIRCEELHVDEGAAAGRASALGRYLGREKIALSTTRQVHLLAMYKVNNRFLENTMVQASIQDCHTRVLDRFLTVSEARGDIEWILDLCKGNITTKVNVTTDLDVPGDESNNPKPLTSFSIFGCFREAMLVQVLALPQGKTVPTKVPASLEASSEELTSRRLIISPKFVLLYTLGDTFNHKPMACLSSPSLDEDLLNSVCLPSTEQPYETLRHDAGAVLKPVDGVVVASGSDIITVRLIENSAQITELNLSYNELKTVDFLRNLLALKSLNLSFNFITSIRNLPKLPCLDTLDLSWNRLEKLPEMLRRLAATCPKLKSLNMNFNPWRVAQEKQGRMVALYLPGLEQLHGQTLTYPDRAVPTFSRLERPMEIGDLNLPRVRPCSSEPTAKVDPRKLTAVCLDSQMLTGLSCLQDIPFLQKLSLNDNLLSSLQGLETFPHLEYLSADLNELTGFEGLSKNSLKLRSLSVRHNSFTNLSSLSGVSLPLLELLDLSGNPMTSLIGLKKLASLTELYVTECNLKLLASMAPLTSCARLLALDLSGNPVCLEENYRRFIVYKVRSLQILDGGCVSSEERADAVSTLSGLLTLDRLQEMLTPPQLSSLTQLDLPSCGIRDISLPYDCLQHVTSLNLEDNQVVLLSGLQHLRQLRVLNLAHNAVRRLRDRGEPPPSAGAACFPALQVLILAGNGVTQLAPLQLGQLAALTALYLHDNDVKALDSMAHCTQLQLLVADRNQLQSLPSDVLITLSSLRALHVEGNRLRRLPTLWPPQLRALYLANNKLTEPLELTRLSGKLDLRRVSLYKNPLTRNLKWQAILCASLPTLQVLDGAPVADVMGSARSSPLDCDGDSADEDCLTLRSNRSVWWRPHKSTVWNYRNEFR